MKRLVFVLALLVVMGVPVPMALATTTVHTFDLGAKGGRISFSATVKHARRCVWSSSPKVAGFDVIVACRAGTIARSAEFPADTSSHGSAFTITLTVHGKSKKVHRWIVNETGNLIAQVAPSITTPLGPGSSGAAVLALQERLVALHYWLGTPNGSFGDSTEQAVYAFEKAAGLPRDGIVGPKTVAALSMGVEPHPLAETGYGIEVDLQDDLVMFVTNGSVDWTFNTSTGGGYTYCVGGPCAVAVTPVGHFSISRAADGLVVDSLGALWRPRYFYEGFAIHGDSYVPPEPVSHGCVRVSNEAIDWIWAANLAPIGTKVWVY